MPVNAAPAGDVSTCGGVVPVVVTPVPLLGSWSNVMNEKRMRSW